jgi:phosphatidate phosphatase APP1
VFENISKDNERTSRSQVTMSGSVPGYGGGGQYGEGREPGSRRKKLAGYLKAANEIRQSYQQSYTQRWAGDNGQDDDGMKGIPGSFPDVAIVSHGDEQLVLFPSYARRHIKEPPNAHRSMDEEDGPGDAEYWAREWQKFEDDNAIVDVDVRGWIYSPHRGPMSRKNRVLIGLARQLSGIPAPKTPSRDNSPDSTSSIRARHREHEARREQEKIAQEAEQILKRGEGEENVASRGGYSEKPGYDSESESLYGDRKKSLTPSGTSNDVPGPGHLSKRASWNHPNDMSQAELLTANSHLMARLRPFMTNPLISTPITVFFYDEKTSVSRTVTTNEAGHFIMRAALEFVPTHVRVLASENLSATEEVKITEPKGVSIISDVDDTIKHSSIGSGAREIFRNTFIRDLGDLTIEGVKEWYNTMYDMGVGVHYVSNSPWQLFPVLVTFFQKAGLPPGSYHLKQYSGMLQGIFEPVAERKKGTLEKIMRDFPERKFILIGDSGEADLEVYTDVVLANPGKVIAIFIRDVTTPETEGFFDSAMGPLSGERGRGRKIPERTDTSDSRMTIPPTYKATARQPTIPPPSSSSSMERRPMLPPRIPSETKPQRSAGPAMGKLIDFDDEPTKADVHESHHRIIPRSASDFQALDSRRKSAPNGSGRVPPPRPSKPEALRATSKNGTASDSSLEIKKTPPPPPKPRRSPALTDSASHPLSQAQNSSDLRPFDEEGYVASARSKVSAVYNALPEVRSYMPGHSSPSRGLQNRGDESAPPPPPRRTGTAGTLSGNITKRMSWNSTDSSDDERPNTVVNKKLDLWKQRWRRAQDILGPKGVMLRSWRTGDDICLEAVQLIEKTMRDMGVEGYGKSSKKTGEGGGEVKVKDLKR